MNIVANSINVIYYNPTTDPYSDAATGSAGAWNAELQNTLSANLTGVSTTLAANNAAYDVGHLFGADGGGGNAGCIGCVCVNDTASTTDKNKGSGFTSPADAIPAGDNFDIDYVAHELGHQFGANHTFSNNNEGSGVNKEVGSGVTIMGYAGITSEDTHPHSIDVFHSASIAQVQLNMSSKTCPTSVAITHSAPVVNAGANWTIPLSTPFVLTGSATDAGGTSTLTYTWEQNDDGGANTGANSAASATKTTGPNWVNYQDSANPVRYFPIMSSILSGSTTTAGIEVTAEALSSVARTLNFRLTARDNVLGQGLTNFDDMIVTVANKTALTVTVPVNTVYSTGSTQTVVWTGATGANGHASIAGGTNVDISFSADNGVTWTTLLTATPNDGSQAVTLPSGVSGAYCRFMVKANANIFFNISRAFAVGNYTYQSQNVCTNYVQDFSNLAITENSSSFTGYYINVPDSFLLTDTNIKVELTHADVGTVFLGVRPSYLTSGVTQFFNGSCDGSANMNLIFDDQGSAINCANTISQAATLPATTFSTYNSNQANGNWIFFLTDIAVGDGKTGTLQKVTLNLCKSEMVPVLASESFEGINDLVIFPNPNNGNFNVQFTSNSGNEIKVGVYDMRGREIFTKSYTNNGLFNENLQLSGVQSGIYLVTIQDGSSEVIKKIVIE